MKKLLILNILLLPLLFQACHEETIDLLRDVSPGYSADFTASSGSIVCTKEYNPITVIYDVTIDLQVAVQSYADITKILINKNLYNANNELIATAIVLDSDIVNDTITLSVTESGDLLEGLSFEPDSIRTGFYFTFETIAVLTSSDTLRTTGSFQVVPQYLNFCTLPVIPTGTYEAHNRITGFKKNVEVRQGVWIYGWVWNETSQAWEMGWTLHPEYYMITDFGLDWCSWNDWWYGAVFTINCPKPGDSRFVIELPGDGFDTTEDATMIDRVTGEESTKTIRLMPYIYQPTTADVGYYDESTGTLIFRNVSVDDNWWHADKHVISDVTFTFKF
jgi:hypothetical protein